MLYELLLAFPGDITQTDIGREVQNYCRHMNKGSQGPKNALK